MQSNHSWIPDSCMAWVEGTVKILLFYSWHSKTGLFQAPSNTNSVPSLLLLSKLYFGGFSECEAADSWNVEGMFISCISHPCDCHVQSQAPFSSWHHNISTPDAPPWAAAGYCLREEQAGDSSQSSCQPGDLFLVPFWDCRSSTWSWLCVFF